MPNEITFDDIKQLDAIEAVKISLASLYREEILTKKYLNIILKYRQWPFKIADAISALHKEDIFTAENWDTVEKDPQHADDIANSLCSLHKAELLTELSRMAVAQHILYHYSLSNALRSLLNLGILTSQSCELIFQNIENVVATTNVLTILHICKIDVLYSTRAIAEYIHNISNISMLLEVMYKQNVLISTLNFYDIIRYANSIINILQQRQFINFPSEEEMGSIVAQAKQKSLTSTESLTIVPADHIDDQIRTELQYALHYAGMYDESFNMIEYCCPITNETYQCTKNVVSNKPWTVLISPGSEKDKFRGNLVNLSIPECLDETRKKVLIDVDMYTRNKVTKLVDVSIEQLQTAEILQKQTHARDIKTPRASKTYC